jgi:hypothetical protein
MAQNLAAQPNFTTAAQSMRVAADEIEKCSNLPAISEGAAIINAIQAIETSLLTKIEAVEARLSTKIEAVEARLSTKIEAVEARLSTKIEAVEARLSTKIEAVEARLSTQVQTLSARVLATYVIDSLHLFNTKMSTYNIYSEHNTTARLQNSLLRLSNAPLMVLHNIRNNPIEAFPGTPAGMQQLRG